MPAWITPEFLEEVPSPALDSFSIISTELPSWLKYLPIDKPTTPAPIIVKSKMIILPKLNGFFMNQVYI
jgi:hypothetical protein